MNPQETNILFNKPEDEIAYLREQLKNRELPLSEMNIPMKSEMYKQKQEEFAHQIIQEHKEVPVHQTHTPEFAMNQTRTESIALSLKPETHDEQISSLYHIMLTHGVKNALTVVAQMKNPHLDDDFHRFLVAFLLSYHQLPKQEEAKELLNPLETTLYEIVMPKDEKDGKDAGSGMSTMEQFFSGMQSLTFPHDPKKKFTYSLEIAMSHDSPALSFFASIPNERRSIFEKQLTALYPHVRLSVAENDYNVFNPTGISMGAYADSSKDEYFPIRTFTEFTRDPLYVITNIFSKLKAKGEGAGVQFIIGHTDNEKYEYFKKIQKELVKGTKLKEAVKIAGTGSVGKFFNDLFVGEKSDKEKEKAREHQNESYILEKVNEKLKYYTLPVCARIITSADTVPRAQEILHDMTSAFHQFSDPQGNSIVFKQESNQYLGDLFHNYIYRLPAKRDTMFLNTKEVATLIHFPELKDAPNENLKIATMSTAPAPLEIGEEGIILGENNHRGSSKNIHYAPEDRLRHMYIIGQTGTGKTSLMVTMIEQDIKNGDGVCYIDPHGSDIQNILGMIPPERFKDVIYFDPAYLPRPMGLNMFEYDYSKPEQKTLIIDELMGIFNQLFDMQAQGGAMFQQYFKNSAFLVMDHPESGNTLLEVTRVLADSEFRAMKLSHCKNPIVRQFWESAEQTTGDQSLANFVPYISSKFDPLISNEFLRPVIAQEKSAFNMRDVMDNKKILLINLSKGRLGELNANLLGMIIVGKIQMAALSRADSHGVLFPNFYLYMDEFQNITTPAISSILSEARKYKLSLIMAHQFMKQLDEKIRNAVLGNVGSMSIFRISPEDAEVLEPRIAPVFTKKDIIGLENFNAYMSFLVGGVPSQPFNMKTRRYGAINTEQAEHIKQLSYMTYGRDRAEVDDEVMSRYKNK